MTKFKHVHPETGKALEPDKLKEIKDKLISGEYIMKWINDRYIVCRGDEQIAEVLFKW